MTWCFQYTVLYVTILVKLDYLWKLLPCWFLCGNNLHICKLFPSQTLAWKQFSPVDPARKWKCYRLCETDPKGFRLELQCLQKKCWDCFTMAWAHRPLTPSKKYFKLPDLMVVKLTHYWASILYSLSLTFLH